MRYEFWAGSYGTAEEETIARSSIDAETGQITKLYGYRGAENPSWIGMNAAKTMLYSVEELTPEGRDWNLRPVCPQKEQTPAISVWTKKRSTFSRQTTPAGPWPFTG